MNNPQTYGEWEAVGFRVVEFGEIDKYPRIKFEPPGYRIQTPDRKRAARAAQVRHRVPNDGGVKYLRAIRAADRRAAAYCQRIKDSA